MGLKKTRVRLHMEKGPTVEGLMVKRPKGRGGYFLISAGELLHASGERSQFTSDVTIPRERVIMYEQVRA